MPLVAGSVAALACVIVGVLVVVGVRGRVEDYDRQQTTTAALRIIQMIKRDRLPGQLPPTEGIEAAEVLDARGRVVSATRDLIGKPPIASFVPGEDTVSAYRVLCPPHGLHGCMDVIAFRVFQPDGDWTVYAAERAGPWYASGPLLAFLLATGLLVVLLTVVLTRRTVDRTLAPVNAIRSELAEITATESARRVPVPPVKDEIRHLAETANSTLDRLDAALERQRRFTSDASHDLRSPIAGARTQLEEALLYPDQADWPRVAQNVLVSLDRLNAIVTDLLALARLDASSEAGDDEVDLALLVSTELARAVRDTHTLTDLDQGVVVRGDRLQLARLLTNLLTNAERHAASRIWVSVAAEGDDAVLTVTDDGAGIPPQDRELVFQRFVRLRESRDRDPTGTGLGLPIAREIARSHGGTLTLADSEQGARFVLRLPRVRPVKGRGTR
ncbi:HAMP domain-containing protein [Actinomadura logoneensis]|uniref:histidine kinase n=1 Tax=Actinomadura logoneensis TaxID=2293572 RepID=A0A372JTU0_9ACTN|nr:HAMP domain-containing sensor histidine kinase [Actinomadura logoneensis]RFU42778.1 HAMP domain-containing protein [Actinomadura logoneensis]